VNEHHARSWSTIVTRSIAVAAAVGVGLLLGADVFADGDAAGHVRYHASIALVVLAMAILPARHAEGSARAMAPAIGLWLFAQLVEAVGGAGFDAANETRNGIAWIHDLGLGLTGLGLVAAVVGIAVGIQGGLARRGVPRGIAFGGGAAILGVGLFVIKTLIGV
jgi:hypothetical protein